nr:hypothetical protein [Tanacetum cinerariifolium]
MLIHQYVITYYHLEVRTEILYCYGFVLIAVKRWRLFSLGLISLLLVFGRGVGTCCMGLTLYSFDFQSGFWLDHVHWLSPANVLWFWIDPFGMIKRIGSLAVHDGGDGTRTSAAVLIVDPPATHDVNGAPQQPREEEMETYATVSEKNQKWIDVEVKAVQIILTRTDNDIYSTVDACSNAIEM